MTQSQRTTALATGATSGVRRATAVAAVIAFLASPAASFVNGAVVPVDGGQSITLATRTPRPIA